MIQPGTTLRHGWFHLAVLLCAAAVITLVVAQVRHTQRRYVQHTAERRRRSQFALTMWSEKGRQGLREEALRQLQAVPDADLSAAQRQQRDLAIAEFLFDRVREEVSTDADGDLRRAEQLLQPILIDGADRALLARAQNCLILTGFKQREWFATARRIDALWADYPESRSNDELTLLKAICLSQMRDYPPALELCEAIINRGAEPVQARAHLQAGDVLLAMLRSGDDQPPVRSRGRSADGQGATANLLRKARTHYENALDQVRPGEPCHAFVLNGLIDTCMLSHDLDSARRYAVEADEPIVAIGERVRSYLLMAELDRETGRVPEAVQRLQTCIQRFPQDPESEEAYFLLFELHRQARRWQEAAELLQKLTARLPGRATTMRMLDLFLTPNSTLIDEICEGNKQAGLVAFRDVLLRLKKQSPLLWRQVHEGVDYLLGVLELRRGEVERAESLFLRCLQDPFHSGFRERALFDDLRCAVLLQHSPAVVAYRAKRYLARHDRNPRGQEARMHLVDAYCDMGLYAAAVQASAGSLLPGLLKANAAGQLATSSPGIQCVAQSAQAYTRVGSAEKAIPLFRACLQQATGTQFPASVFLDWAEAARAGGQAHEAARRLDLGIERLLDPKAKQRLQVARNVLGLQLGAPETETKARENLAALETQAATESETRACWRELCEALLQFHCSRGELDSATAVLMQACNTFAGTPWIDAWRCRLLRLKLETGGVNAAMTWLTDTSGTRNGDHGADPLTSGIWQRQQDLVRRLAALADQVRKRQENQSIGGEHVARN